jgi:hypothetical protein
MEIHMKKALMVGGGIVVLATLSGVALAISHRAPTGAAPAIIQFQTMYGVDGPFLNPANAIRGVMPDDLPWEVESAKGRLHSDGHLRIHIEGLVFKDDPSVPPELRGKNDEPFFRGLVSCITEDEDAGTTPVVNVVTDGFPASIPEGDSDIEANVELPNPCVAPIVFILAGSEDKWFAVTGFEEEED